MELRTRRLIFGPLVLWIWAAWTVDPLQTQFVMTGALLLIPTLASALACVDWYNF